MKQQDNYSWLGEAYSKNTNRIKMLTFWLFFFFLFVMSFTVELDNWVYTHWLFNYEFGFIKRGLLGEVVRQFGIFPSYEWVVRFSFPLAVATSLLMAFIFYTPIMRYKTQTGAFFIAIFWLSHPATVQHFIYEIGRPDNLLYIFFCGCVLLLTNLSFYPGLFLSMIVLTLMILIHEASFPIFLPSLFGILLLTNGARMTAMKLAFLVATTVSLVGFLLYVGTKGLMAHMSFDEYAAYLAPKDVHVSMYAITIYYRSLLENVGLAFRGFLDGFNILRHAVTLLGLIPTFIIFNKIVNTVVEIKGWLSYEILLFLLSASPLSMYLLGHDHLRWWSMALTNFAIVMMVIMRDEVVAEKLIYLFFELRWLVVLTIMLGLMLGPFGVLYSFDNVRGFIDALYVIFE